MITTIPSLESRNRFHVVALHPDEMHQLRIRIGKSSKFLADLTPPECRMIATLCLGEKTARKLLRDVPGWDFLSTWWLVNELAQSGLLQPFIEVAS